MNDEEYIVSGKRKFKSYLEISQTSVHFKVEEYGLCFGCGEFHMINHMEHYDLTFIKMIMRIDDPEFVIKARSFLGNNIVETPYYGRINMN